MICTEERTPTVGDLELFPSPRPKGHYLVQTNAVQFLRKILSPALQALPPLYKGAFVLVEISLQGRKEAEKEVWKVGMKRRRKYGWWEGSVEGSLESGKEAEK